MDEQPFTKAEREAAKRRLQNQNRLMREIARLRAFTIPQAEARLAKARAWEAVAHELTERRDNELAEIQQRVMELEEELEDA